MLKKRMAEGDLSKLESKSICEDISRKTTSPYSAYDTADSSPIPVKFERVRIKLNKV
jgi:hypothetical protein